ncbi:MAG: ribonuclease P protein component [Clostridia bacterium]|nr:ribonuclease P protein component [Clostridia bacterium]
MKLAAIKEHHLYNKAYQKGNRASGQSITVYVLRDYAAHRLMLAHPQHLTVNRVGISVSKKIGGACVRNRAKRIIREAYRAILREGQLKVGFLVVIAAKPEIATKKSGEIESELRRAFDRLQFFRRSAAEKKCDGTGS